MSPRHSSLVQYFTNGQCLMLRDAWARIRTRVATKPTVETPLWSSSQLATIRTKYKTRHTQTRRRNDKGRPALHHSIAGLYNDTKFTSSLNKSHTNPIQYSRMQVSRWSGFFEPGGFVGVGSKLISRRRLELDNNARHTLSILHRPLTVFLCDRCILILDLY